MDIKDIRNEAQYTKDEVVNGLRGAIEHRATWMGLMMREAENMGYDAESFTRSAIKQCGLFHGAGILERQEGEGIPSFQKAFIPEKLQKIFEMEIQHCDEEKLEVEFHYCPLVAGWIKQGFDAEKIKLMCDCAMDGDRGIAEAHGYKFKLGTTIAKGGHVCEVGFYKK